MSEIITFGTPLWFSVGAVVIALLIFLYTKMAQRREQTLQVFAAPHLLGKLCSNVSSKRRLLKRILLLAAIACCFTALARPQYGYKWIDVKRKGIDILFAVDTSKSMLAEDVSPNRLKRAKFAILDFVGQLQGDRVGIMPFAGAAFLMCPMTIDYSAFESSLGAIDTTIIPKGGTDLAAVIAEAEKVLSNEANHKILVLITDGENLQGDVLKAATAAADKGMTIYSVGVGSSEGELIPFNRDGKSGFVKDESGNFITSRLDENMLTQIAELTGGLYVPLGSRGEGLQTIYQKKLSLIPKEEVAEKRHKVALERFVWPLGAAIVLLMFEFLLGGRKSARGLRIPFIKTAGRRNKQKMAAVLLLLFGLGALVSVEQAEASKGEDAYGNGDFLTASMVYDELLQESPNDARLHYNYGTAAYKNNMFEDAAKAFSEALKSDDLELQKEAYYNRGNALFQRGNETLQTDPQHTIKMWTEAVASFDGALQLDSMNDDAHYNLDLVKTTLEELKKQQEQQDQEKKDQDQQSDDEKEQQGDQDQKESKDQGEQTKEDKSSDNDSGKQESQEEGQEQQKDSESEKQGEEAEQDQKDASAGEEEQGEDEQGAEEQEAAREKEQQEAAARAMERRSQGKMTEEEAKQLLNSLKDETGELDFVPAAISSGTRDQKISKDW